MFMNIYDPIVEIGSCFVSPLLKNTELSFLALQGSSVYAVIVHLSGFREEKGI